MELFSNNLLKAMILNIGGNLFLHITFYLAYNYPFYVFQKGKNADPFLLVVRMFI